MFIYIARGTIVAQLIIFTSTSSFNAAIVEFKEEKLFPAKLGEAFLPLKTLLKKRVLVFMTLVICE